MLRIPAYCGGPIILSFSELFAGPSSHVALPVRSKTPRLSGGTVVKLLTDGAVLCGSFETFRKASRKASKIK